MDKKRTCVAQKTVPNQSNRQNSCKAGSITRSSEEKSIQDGPPENKEIPQVSWPIIAVTLLVVMDDDCRTQGTAPRCS